VCDILAGEDDPQHRRAPDAGAEGVGARRPCTIPRVCDLCLSALAESPRR
jgi:hypothetical protein